MIKKQSAHNYEGVNLPRDICMLIGLSMCMVFGYIVFNMIVTYMGTIPLPPSALVPPSLPNMGASPSPAGSASPIPSASPSAPPSIPSPSPQSVTSPAGPTSQVILPNLSQSYPFREGVAYAVRANTIGSEIVVLAVLNAMLIYAFLSRDILDIIFNLSIQAIIIAYTFWVVIIQPWETITILLMASRIAYFAYILGILLQIFFSRKRFAWSFFKIHGPDIRINRLYRIRQIVKIAYRTFIILFFFRWILSQALLNNITLMVINLSLIAAQMATGLYVDVESYLLRMFMIALSIGVAIFYLIQIIFSEDFINFPDASEIPDGTAFTDIWLVLLSLVLGIQVIYSILLALDMSSFGEHLTERGLQREKKRMNME